MDGDDDRHRLRRSGWPGRSRCHGPPPSRSIAPAIGSRSGLWRLAAMPGWSTSRPARSLGTPLPGQRFQDRVQRRWHAHGGDRTVKRRACVRRDRRRDGRPTARSTSEALPGWSSRPINSHLLVVSGAATSPCSTSSATRSSAGRSPGSWLARLRSRPTDASPRWRASTDNDVALIDVATARGGPRTAADAAESEPSTARFAAFSPDGASVAVGSAASDGQPAEIEIFSTVGRAVGAPPARPRCPVHRRAVGLEPRRPRDRGRRTTSRSYEWMPRPESGSTTLRCRD